MILKNLSTAYLFNTATCIQFFCIFYYTTPITIHVVPIVLFTFVVVHRTIIVCALINFIVSGPGAFVAFVVSSAFVAFVVQGTLIAFVTPIAFVVFVVSGPGAFVAFVSRLWLRRSTMAMTIIKVMQ